MNFIQDTLVTFVEKNAVFFHAWGTFLIILGFLILLILIYYLNKLIKPFRLRLITTVILIFPMIFLTLLTFLLTSPLNSFISTLAIVESAVGKPAPGFEFISLSDNVIHNISEFRGKTIILNYWGTGCVKCKNEMPDLKELEQSEPERLIVVSISNDPIDSVRNFIHDHPSPPLTGICPGDQWIDPGSHLPFIIIIDKSGIIREYFYGREDFQDLKKACNKYLNRGQ